MPTGPDPRDADSPASVAGAPPAPKSRPDFAELFVALACGFALTCTALFLAVMPMVSHLTGSRDFGVYWATGRQLVLHGNPFDPASMKALELAGGLHGNGAFYMRNLPWALPLAWPLGLVSPALAAIAWSLLMIALLAVSVRILWTLLGQTLPGQTGLGRPGVRLDLLGYAFPPALLAVVMGQTSLFVLFGLALFLRFHRTRPLLAGAALWFWTLKPQLFVPVAVVLLAWILVTRGLRILLGLAAALAATSLLITALDPAVWTQYLHWARHSGIADQYIPCLSVTLRDQLAPGNAWIAFVPGLLAAAWAVAYFWPRRHTWDWIENGNLLLLVSLVVAPYCWIYDQCLAVPAVLWAASRTASRTLLVLLAAFYLLIEIIPLVFPVAVNSPLYLWTAPAWLAWYLLARASAQRAPAAATSAATLA